MIEMSNVFLLRLCLLGLAMRFMHQHAAAELQRVRRHADASSNRRNVDRNGHLGLKPDAFRLMSGRKISSTTSSPHVLGISTFALVVVYGHSAVAMSIGGAYVATQVTTLDDVDFAEIVAAPIRDADGRNNNWGSVPAECRHL